MPRYAFFRLKNDPLRVGKAIVKNDDRLETIEGAQATTLDEVILLPPAQPTKIIGVGLNYRAHAAEMKKALPKEPLLFLIAPSALIADREPIVRPTGFDRVDYEGELAIIIKKQARYVKAKDALDYIEGFSCMNDVTVRDLQKRDVQYTRAKGFDSFAPLGPFLATDLDPANLRIQTRVNGELRQDSSTSDMIFSVKEIIEVVSRVMTLMPGDVITTGTPPGVGQANIGDQIEVQIEGIGCLHNRVVEEPAF